MSTPKSIMVIIAYGLLTIVVGVLIWIVIHRLFIAPGENAANEGRAIIGEETTRAAGAAAQDSLETVREIHTEHYRIDEITQRNDDAIKTTPGADTRAPAIAGALQRSLCSRAAYQSDPRCAAVLGDHQGDGTVGRDPGGAAPR